jgi:alpha-1,2-mannosyltransferase
MVPYSASVRKRLWKWGSLIALFMLILAIGNHFLPQSRSLTRQMLGHDFLVFYSGGQLARTGQYHDLYNMDTLKRMEHATGVSSNLEMGNGFGPWWNPPHAAWMFSPLTFLSYPNALIVWQFISMIAFAISVYLLARMLPEGTSWKTWALIPLFMMISMPFVQAISHGQNTFITLLLLTITATLWRKNRGFLAGIVCGLLAYKPQHCALIAIVLVFNQGIPAVCGLAITGAATLAFTTIAMPGALHDFLFRMPANLTQFQESNHYMWERHVTFKGFWRLLLQGRDTGPTSATVMVFWFACWGAIAAMLRGAIWNVRIQNSKLKLQNPTQHSGLSTQHSTDRLIAATIAATPLLMPFYFDYDMLLLSVAAVLYVADRMRSPAMATDRLAAMAWTTLFISFQFGTVIAGQTHFNVNVLALTWVATVLIRRAWTNEQSITILLPDYDSLAAVRLAA